MFNKRFIRKGTRAKAVAAGYRSGLEHVISKRLTDKEITFGYEDTKIPYVVPAKEHKYTPDFTMKPNVYLETKGIWTAEDRKKHLLIKEQHPEVKILLIFGNPNNKISRGSKTSYADFCIKNDLPYIGVDDEIPEEWYEHKT